MNRYLLVGIVTVICLCFRISKSDACYPPPCIEVDPYQQHKPLSIFDTDKVWVYANCLSGYPITSWSWSFPNHTYDYEIYEYSDQSIAKCRFDATGKFWFGVTGYNEWGSDYDNCVVYVFEMDLDISGVSDDNEEEPGGSVYVNNDDDNDNGTPDKDETGTVSGEDDLVAISLSYSPSDLYSGYVELKMPYSDSIKVWSSSNKGTLVIDSQNRSMMWPLGSQPSTLYVEGCSSGSADLWLLYTPDGQNYPGGTENHDPVKFNVEYNTEVVVDKVVEEGTTDEGPLYPGCPGTSVYLEAKPNPSYASFPAGEPHWTVQGPFGTCPYFSEDTGPTTRLFPGYKWGDYIVTAKCGSNDPGDSITVKFNLVNEIPWGIYTPTWGTTQYCSARDLLCDKTS